MFRDNRFNIYSGRSFDTAVVLAGGKSSRLAFDKQTIRIKGKLIAVYIGELLSQEFSQVLIISNKPELYGEDCPYKVIPDVLPGLGPKGGILSGLLGAEFSGDMVYFTGCDMPFVNLEYVRYLKKLLIQSPAITQVALARKNGYFEPLNAFYSKALIPEILSQLDEGNNKISTLYTKESTLVVEESALKELDPADVMFINLNTQRDFEKLVKKGF
jgi:molybdopterin-guanine dinucleotide biosynthesis protein A